MTYFMLKNAINVLDALMLVAATMSYSMNFLLFCDTLSSWRGEKSNEMNEILWSTKNRIECKWYEWIQRNENKRKQKCFCLSSPCNLMFKVNVWWFTMVFINNKMGENTANTKRLLCMCQQNTSHFIKWTNILSGCGKSLQFKCDSEKGIEKKVNKQNDGIHKIILGSAVRMSMKMTRLNFITCRRHL